MTLTDKNLNVFITQVLHLGQGKRKEYLDQVDYLIDRLTAKITADTSFKVKGFRKTGSLMKGTVLKPKGDHGVDADIAVFLDLTESEKEDEDQLHEIILKLLKSVYPTKTDTDFRIQPRTLGVYFRDSELDVDLVPVIPIKDEPGFGWQPSSQAGEPVKTSIGKQLEFIASRKKADPRWRSLVRLVKKWRNEQGLTRFRSFTIELIVSYLNDSQGMSDSLENGLKRFFLYIASTGLKEPISFPELGENVKYPDDPVVILDPVNKENNVAARLTDDERREIVSAAKSAWETIEAAVWKSNKGETLDLWKELFGRSFTIEETDK